MFRSRQDMSVMLDWSCHLTVASGANPAVISDLHTAAVVIRVL
jgi:hypothetical protein